MDLRQFSSTPTPMDYQHLQQMQQQQFNPQQQQQQQHHQLNQQQFQQMNQINQQQQQQQQLYSNQNSAASLNAARLKQSRYFNGGSPGPQASNNNLNGLNNVGPWIEQQQQVVSNPTTNSFENQTFVNNYGNNLNHQQPQQNMLPLQQSMTGNSNISQSLQNNYDSQSSKPSPSNSNISTFRAHGLHNPLLNEMNINDSHDRQQQQQINTDIHNQPPLQQQQLDDNDNDNDDMNETNNNNEDEDDEDDDNDELIPTAIVIKNIPFAIKKEQLLDVMTKLNLPLPYAFNYHFDNGVFRGLAFANFTSTDETTAVVNHLNGREIGGRKLRVEYKKMLPLAERERIEREKREKRGQLEEQHRSASNASLASMISVASAPAGVNKLPQTPLSMNNLALNGNVGAASNQQFLNNQVNATAPPSSNGNNNGSNNLQSVNERFYAPIPVYNNLPTPPNTIDLNDSETLEYYNQLIFFRDDKEKFYNEIAYPQTLNGNHRKVISVVAQFLGLVEVLEGNLILIKRRHSSPDSVLLQSNPLSAASLNSANEHMMMNTVPNSLLRSHSQSSLPMLNSGNATQHQSNRFRPANAPNQHQPQPLQPLTPQHQQMHIPQPQQIQQSQVVQAQQTSSRIPPSFQLGGLSLNNSILRNNPTPTGRSISGLYQQNFYQPQPTSAGGQPSAQQQPHSQPTTPGLDPMARFNLTSANVNGPPGLTANLTGGSMNGGNLNSNVENELNDSLNGLNLSMDGSSGANTGNIWSKNN